MPSSIGARLRRREDPRLVTGQGEFAGDVRPPGLLHAAFVRSPHAHARVKALRLEAARAMPGVVGAFGPSDLPVLGHTMPAVISHPAVQARLASPLASDVVRYAGEAVAVVVADDPYRAADAREAVTVEYEPLPAVVDPKLAQQDGTPLVHDVPTNVAGRIRAAVGDVEAAFTSAALVLTERFSFARAAGCAIEPRAVTAEPGNAGRDGIAVTLWDSTQAPHMVREAVAAALDLPASRVRVVAPDVGGGFGVKGRLYAEEIVLAALALHLHRPISWVATRTEDLLTTYHGRGQVVEAELAARADGTILGLRVHITQDCGAYLPTGIVVSLSSAQHVLGPYHVPAYSSEVVAVYTNKPPLTPLRGGGRPQGVFIMERLLDHLARALDLDPPEVRRRNLIAPDEFPYDTGYPSRGGGTVIYDSGDYPACLDRARALIAYDAVRRAQPDERKAGRYRGVAVTAFLESTGTGEEGARVEIDADGAVRVTVGSPSQGQSHATTLAQICADRLGVPVARVAVSSGDTAAFERGTGTFASRIAVMAGNAVAGAAREMRRRVLEEAATLLEVSAGDLELSEGIISVRGVPDRTLSLAEVARALQSNGDPTRLGVTHTFAPERAQAFAGGAHAAVVEVDIETGSVRVERYVVVHDCGTVINPTVVEGQIHGGVAHGLGNALYEAIVYDHAGQLLSGSLMDYALPGADMVPNVTVVHADSPSPFNPEGIKGAGEGGTIGALATIAGAVEDALAPFNLTLNDLPLQPEDLARAISRATSGATSAVASFA